jgi:hypothetical protein
LQILQLHQDHAGLWSQQQRVLLHHHLLQLLTLH